MSQSALGDALGITFQQVQKYEKGSNRVSASRLQHMAQILQVPASFFFDEAATQQKTAIDAPSFEYVFKFVSSREGLALVRAFTRIDSKKRRPIVSLVEEIARHADEKA